MPTFTAMSVPLRIAGVLGHLQAAGLAVYAVSIAAVARGGQTAGVTGTDLAPSVLIGLYLAFAAIAYGVSRALVRGRRRALTPFLLLQAFAVVVAQPLLAESSTRALGVGLVVVALGAAVAAIASRAVLR